MSERAPLRFQALQSSVDPVFWAELRRRKLHEYRLNEDPLPISGKITASAHAEVASCLQLDQSAFDSLTEDYQSQAGWYSVPGTLVAFNTVEGFQQCDRAALMAQAATGIWAAISSGQAETDPSLLMPFFLLCYVDMKTYKFYYWFGFPVIKPPEPFLSPPVAQLAASLGDTTASKVAQACDKWRAGQAPNRQHVWIILLGDNGQEPQAVALSEWKAAHKSGSKWIIAAADPCHLQQHPGWVLRNVLLIAASRWGLRQVTAMCVRETRGRTDPARCLVVDAELPDVPAAWDPLSVGVGQVVGWEANASGKPGPRSADIGAFMDPHKLAESAVDLNLSLMRWRAAPSLDVASVSSTKCLLLGAGTLGCAVARTLLGWGVRHVTLVDSGRVAFSNPVRQSLYTFTDCLDGGRPKAEAAAEALRAVFPGVTANGIQMAIPMPGHPVGVAERAAAKADSEQLEELVKAHDVVFLLTDTRESRWLPTVLTAAHSKLAINAALGYDSFLVMRHGPPERDTEGPDTQSRLGCYFCNDVVAPLDSTRNRAMDQQCTVARPGLAPIAGALAVELMAAVTQHPLGIYAPAPSSNAHGPEGQPALGKPPHMVRGNLSGFGQQCLEGRAFSQCTACSTKVVQAVKQEGWEFLLKVFDDPMVLEELTGLAELQRQTAKLCLDMEDDAADMGGSDEEWAEI